MKPTELERQMILKAANGNQEAADFLWKGCQLFHAVDDLVDVLDLPAEQKIATVLMGMDLYWHPFFVRHAAALNAAVRLCASTWADSVAWERSEDDEKRAWSDVLRHSGIELIAVVADICGGWAHRRAVSLEWREYVRRSECEERKQTNGGKYE